MEWLDQIISVLVILVLLTIYLCKKHSYWKEHGIPQPKTKFLLGHFKFEMKNQISQYAQMSEYYKALKKEGPFVGLYFFTKPAILVTSVDMAKAVFVKDFDHFVDHGHYYNEKDDPISATLFNVNEESWRRLRSSLSPTFTGSKMKVMFPNVLEIVDNNLIPAMDGLVKEQPQGFPIQDLMSRLTTDIIGDVAFGLRCNSFEDPTNEFRRMGTLSFKRSIYRTLKINFITLFPKWARMLRIKRIRPEVAAFYSNIVTKTVEYREKNNVVRNDFLNLLMELKNDPKSEKDRFTLLQVIAQSFLFFTAGFETSSTTLALCLYELAVEERVQEKTRKHIQEVLKKHNGVLCYEALQDLTYLDKVLSETLRKNPVLTIINRVVTKDYKVPETDVILKRGTPVLIPVHSIHHDPENHPNPDKFDPERFNPDRNMHPCSYLGFGFGSRSCIASRFAMMNMKIALVRMLTRFRFERAIETQVPMQFDYSRPSLGIKGGVPLKVIRIE